MTKEDENKNNPGFGILGGLLVAGAAVGSAYYLNKKNKEMERAKKQTVNINLEQIKALSFRPSFLTRPTFDRSAPLFDRETELVHTLTNNAYSFTKELAAGKEAKLLDAYRRVASLVQSHVGEVAALFYKKGVNKSETDTSGLQLALAINALEETQLSLLSQTYASTEADATPDLSTEIAKQIDNDVPRTFRGNTDDSVLANKRKSLRTLLFALASTDVGYCQGMNFVAGHAVDSTADLAEAVVVCFSLLFAYKLSATFERELSGLHYAHLSVERLMRRKTPELFAQLERRGVLVQTWCSQWFLTVFVYTFPSSVLARIWDGVFLEGFLFLLKVAVAILTVFERLRVWEEKELQKALSEFPKTFELDEAKFMELVYSFQFTYDEIEKAVEEVPAQNETLLSFVAKDLKTLFE